MKKKKVLIVPDSFKGSLSAKDVADAITSGFSDDKFETKTLPVSDGGDGAIDVLLASGGFKKRKLTAHNAYGIIKDTDYLLDSSGGAFIAVSDSSGIQNLDGIVLNPLNASTFGTGEVINHVINSGVNTVNLLLGGSATIDGGTGMFAALGASFYEVGKQIISYKTNPLVRYDRVEMAGAAKHLKNIRVNIITDVDNLIIGEFGATRIYGMQKGAGIEEVKIIESKMLQWVEFLEKSTNKKLKLISGMGAAGGIGLPLIAFSNTKIFKGAEWFIDKLNIKELIDWSDIVITGEGKIDEQTTMGKIPGEIAKITGDNGKPVIGVCGKLARKIEGFDMLFSLMDEFNISERYAITNAKKLLAKIAIEIARKL